MNLKTTKAGPGPAYFEYQENASREQKSRQHATTEVARREVASTVAIGRIVNGEPRSGGASVGHASLMRPDRPLPRVPSHFSATSRPERRLGDHRGPTDPVGSFAPPKSFRDHRHLQGTLTFKIYPPSRSTSPSRYTAIETRLASYQHNNLSTRFECTLRDAT